MATNSDSSPGESVRQRVLADVRATPSPARPVVSRRDAVLAAVATAGSLLLFALIGGVRPTDRPWSLVAGTAGGLALVAAFALATIARRTMVGPSRQRLIALSLLAPLFFLAWKMIISSVFDGATAPWPDRPGARCFGWTVLLTALPFIAAVFVRWHSDATHPVSHGSALGVTVGMGAAVLVDLWCPVGHLPHVLGGHVLPIIVLGVLGALAGRYLLAVRRF